MTFEYKSDATDMNKRPDGTIRLLLFQSSVETVNTGIAVKQKKATAICYGIPVWINYNRRIRKFASNPRSIASISSVKSNVKFFSRKCVRGQTFLAML